MTEVYKLLFDLSLYFTLSSYYLRLTAGDPPSAVIFLAFCCMIALDAFLRRFPSARQRVALRILPVLVPLLALLARPTLGQALFAVPLWAFLAFSLLTDRIGVDYDGFRAHYSFALKLLLLMVFGPLFPDRLAAAFLSAVPFLVLMLACGVCLLRLLRGKTAEGLRQGVYIAIFVLVCAGLTLGRAPQALLRLAGIAWQYVAAPLIFAAAIALGVLCYGGYLLMKWIVERAQGSSEPFQLDMQGAAQYLGLEDQYNAYTADLRWLKLLLIAIGVCLLLFFLWLVFRRMLGDRAAPASRSSWRQAQSAHHGASSAKRVPTLLQPRDPRLAVRYFYARFLTECRRRGLSILPGMTASELADHCVGRFPGADPSSLRALYSPARYSARQTITRADVNRAAEAFRLLKQSEYAGDHPEQRRRKH